MRSSGLDANQLERLHRFARDEDSEWRKGYEEAAAFLFDDEAGVEELLRVFGGELVVGDEGDAAGFEDADDLDESAAADGAS